MQELIIETTDPATNGTSYNQSKVRVRTKITPLSENANEVKKWLTEQPDAFTIFKKYSYDEMKESLLAWLHPEETAEEAEVTPVAAPVNDIRAEVETKQAVQPASFALSTKKKSNIDEEFDELFSLK